MKSTLHIYLARPRRGHWEASVPWGGPLSAPVRGPSPAQLKEQLMFQATALVQADRRDDDLDALVPPENLRIREFALRLEEASGTVTSHAVLGQWPGDVIWRAWLPRIPGVCLPLESPEDLQTVAQRWADEWQKGDEPLAPSRLEAEFPAELDTIDLDLSAAQDVEPDEGDGDGEGGEGRLTQPETLREVADNLVHQADDDRLDHAYGRERIVERLVEVITGSEAAHLCLVGPAGTGKSAVIDEAVRRSRKLQQDYQQRRDVWRTTGDRLIAGMSRVGQWEERTRRACRELSERGDVLVVGDLLALIRAGRSRQGGAGVARFIEPHLHQGDFSVIVEASERTFDVARSEAPGFVEAFRRVQVPSMTEDEALEVVNALARRMEQDHPVRFTPDGIEAALRLSRRYFRREVFPGKAVRLMRHCLNDARRRASALADGQHDGGSRNGGGAGDDEDGDTSTDDSRSFDGSLRVGSDQVSRVVHRRTGLPMRMLKPGAGRRPSEVRDSFESRVFDQPRASEVVTDLIVAVEQGICDPRHPLGSLLLIGPSGVGKTETAKTMADELFGSEDRLVRFDMSEFAEPAAATRLIGTPNDPDGELTGRVRVQPYCVLLFDEIEKAHPAVLDLLLQLLGDGRLTDAGGRTVDFTNTVVAMTSNLGADEEERWVGFQGGDDSRQKDRTLHYRRAAEDFFRPEMFNRIGRIIPFHPLSQDTLRRIARRTLRELMDRRGLRQPQIMVDVAPNLVEHLVGDAVDDRYGARTLGHRIERKLIAPLARQLTQRRDTEGLTRVTLRPGGGGEAQLKLHELDEAPRSPDDLPEGVADPPARPEVLAPQFEALFEQIRLLLGSDPVATLTQQHEELLEAINLQEDAASPESLERAERLRQREIVRNTLQSLEGFARDLADAEAADGPDETGGGGRARGGNGGPNSSPGSSSNGHSDDKLAVPDLRDAPRARLHEWSRRYGRLARQLTWVRCQLEAVRQRDIDAGTLIWTGLSGPAHHLLQRWWRWLSAWAIDHEVELAGTLRRGGRWVSAHADEELPDGADITAIALSGEHPGVGTLFRRLTGYTFAPQPPTHGRHALAVAEVDDWGTSEADRLHDYLTGEGRREGVPEPTGARVEFVVEKGRLRDLRLGTDRTMPEKTGDAAREFADRLATGRIALDPRI